MVRKNLYVANSLSDNLPVAEKFEVASKINNNSFVSHHSAFEFYGFANQVFNEVSVLSLSKFRDFNFSNDFFKFCKEKAGKSVRYLESDLEKSELIFNKEWNLCVPKNLPI